jgi:hypothetical protein
MILDGGGVIAIAEELADVWNNGTDSEQKASRHPFSFPPIFFIPLFSLSLSFATQEEVGKQIMTSFS